MAKTIKVASIQTSYGEDLKANIEKTERFVREAASKGAQVILPSELFQGPYFCTTQEEKWFGAAHEATTHPCVLAMAPLAKELGVVIPVSIYERDGPLYYNSVVIVDADGKQLGVYRKSHIPRLSREVLLSPRRYRFQSLGHSVRAHRRRHLLGPVVP